MKNQWLCKREICRAQPLHFFAWQYCPGHFVVIYWSASQYTQCATLVRQRCHTFELSSGAPGGKRNGSYWIRALRERNIWKTRHHSIKIQDTLFLLLLEQNVHISSRSISYLSTMSTSNSIDFNRATKEKTIKTPE